MADIVQEIDWAIDGGGVGPRLKEILREAATEIARLRVKNTELNRRSQKANAAARDTYLEARQKGGSFGRVLANCAAGMWRDLAVVLADEMAYQMRGGDDDDCREDIVCRIVGPGFFINLVSGWLAEGEILKDEAAKVRERFSEKLRERFSEQQRTATDAVFHPTGRCTCAGEGACEWCQSHCLHCGVGLLEDGTCPGCHVSAVRG